MRLHLIMAEANLRAPMPKVATFRVYRDGEVKTVVVPEAVLERAAYRELFVRGFDNAVVGPALSEGEAQVAEDLVRGCNVAAAAFAAGLLAGR